MSPLCVSRTATTSSLSIGGLVQETLSVDRKVAGTLAFPNTHDKSVEFLKFLPTTKTDVPPLTYP